LVTLAAVAVNVVDAEPAGTVTEAGTLRLVLLLPTARVTPPGGAAALRVAVHAEVPGVTTVVGIQVKELRVTAWPSVIVPPIPLTPRVNPDGSVPIVFIITD
jgi:hypothetical protein